MTTAVIYELAALSSFLFNLSLCHGRVPTLGVTMGEAGMRLARLGRPARAAGGGGGLLSALRSRSYTGTLLGRVALTERTQQYMQHAAHATLPGRHRRYYFSDTPRIDEALIVSIHRYTINQLHSTIRACARCG